MEDEFKLIDIVRRLNGEKPPKQKQEEYKIPARIRFLRNRVEVYQRQMDELCEDRRIALAEINKFNEKVERDYNFLNDNLLNIEQRLKQVELKLRAVCKDIETEKENI